MRAYNELSALWRAPIFQRSFYEDVGRNWKGIALRYLLLAQLLLWLPTFIRATVGLNRFIEHDARTALKDIPPVKLHRGHLSSPVRQPYLIRDQRGTPVMVLDTTGRTTNPTELGARILFTETTMVQVEASGRVQTTPLAAFPDMDINADWAIDKLYLLRNLIFPVLYPLTVAATIVWRLLAALLLALFGLILAKPLGAELSFGGLMRLAMVSMTTVMLLDTLFGFIPLNIFCFSFVLYPAISLGYMAYAVKVNGDRARLNRNAFPVEFPSQPQY
jgi:hypothetical protein